MTVIDQYIKLLVRAVKKNDVFKATRFICGYSNKEVESPVTDFLVAVTTDNIEINNSFIGNLVGDGLQGEELKVIVRFRDRGL